VRRFTYQKLKAIMKLTEQLSKLKQTPEWKCSIVVAEQVALETQSMPLVEVTKPS
jgi:hypothetical protein